jgi:hypothetical protein
LADLKTLFEIGLTVAKETDQDYAAKGLQSAFEVEFRQKWQSKVEGANQ